jgi:hypothetical protein
MATFDVPASVAKVWLATSPVIELFVGAGAGVGVGVLATAPEPLAPPQPASAMQLAATASTTNGFLTAFPITATNFNMLDSSLATHRARVALRQSCNWCGFGDQTVSVPPVVTLEEAATGKGES